MFMVPIWLTGSEIFYHPTKSEGPRKMSPRLQEELVLSITAELTTRGSSHTPPSLQPNRSCFSTYSVWEATITPKKLLMFISTCAHFFSCFKPVQKTRRKTNLLRRDLKHNKANYFPKSNVNPKEFSKIGEKLE